MTLYTCLLKQNDCYKAGQRIRPQGVMVHSTGANNPWLRRYVQPLSGDAGYEELMAWLGRNQYGNHWNRPGTNACVHAFVGKAADGSVGVAQTLPWGWRGWHAGNGTKKPSANNTHISFEICEDGLNDPGYFEQVYRAAAELTAMLCKTYGLDPLEPETVICHSEGHALGMASGHADVMHWFPRFGKDMDDFRAEVARIMEQGEAPEPKPEPEEDTKEEYEMTQEQFDAMLAEHDANVALEPGAGWSKNERKWAIDKGVTKGVGDLDGDGEKDFSWKSPVTREELVTMLFRLEQVLEPDLVTALLPELEERMGTYVETVVKRLMEGG